MNCEGLKQRLKALAKLLKLGMNLEDLKRTLKA